MEVHGSRWATALTAAQVVGLATVLVLALRRATWVATTLERACITLALGGALLSVALRDPGVAVAAAIAGNITAGIPTYRSVWRRPQDETALRTGAPRRAPQAGRLQGVIFAPSGHAH